MGKVSPLCVIPCVFWVFCVLLWSSYILSRWIVLSNHECSFYDTADRNQWRKVLSTCYIWFWLHRLNAFRCDLIISLGCGTLVHKYDICVHQSCVLNEWICCAAKGSGDLNTSYCRVCTPSSWNDQKNVYIHRIESMFYIDKSCKNESKLTSFHAPASYDIYSDQTGGMSFHKPGIQPPAWWHCENHWDVFWEFWNLWKVRPQSR